MSITYSDISCGVRQLSDLNYSDPKELILHVLDDFYNDGESYSQVCFSDYTHYPAPTGSGKWRRYVSPGVKLAKYIRNNDLGAITETRGIVNRNSGNRIKTWVWNMSNIKKIAKTVGWKADRLRQEGWYP